MMNIDPFGKKEIAESVITAALIALTTGLIGLAVRKIEKHFEKEEKKSEKKEEKKEDSNAKPSV